MEVRKLEFDLVEHVDLDFDTEVETKICLELSCSCVIYPEFVQSPPINIRLREVAKQEAEKLFREGRHRKGQTKMKVQVHSLHIKRGDIERTYICDFEFEIPQELRDSNG